MDAESKDTDTEEERGPRCGERLKAAREELQISLSEVSKELHLDEQKVLALEANDFETLGAPVFAKGHLKKYAHLVKVSEDDILLDYHELTRAEGLPPVVPTRARPTIPKSPAPFLGALAVIIVIALIGAAAYWYFVVRVRAPVTLPPPPEPQSSVTLPSTEVVEDPMQQPVELQVIQDPVVDDTPVSESQPAETRPAGPDAMSIVLAFSGDCWTEITDAAGERLFFDLGRAGREIRVSGQAPVSVLLGNAGNVELTVNGLDYDIAQDDRRGDTARFTLYGN